MREISRTALVPYTPAQMFALVDDFVRYPEFLPWVAHAELIERTDVERVGVLQISRAGLNERVTTRNTVKPPNRLEMRLLDGPFRVLEGLWTFDAIADRTSEADLAPDGTRVGFSLRFEFKNRMLDMLAAPKFASSCDAMVDAFVKRARDVYGHR